MIRRALEPDQGRLNGNGWRDDLTPKRKTATQTIRVDSDVRRYVLEVEHELELRYGRRVSSAEALAVIIWLGEECLHRPRRSPGQHALGLAVAALAVSVFALGLLRPVRTAYTLPPVPRHVTPVAVGA